MPNTIDRLKSALADRYEIERQVGQGGMATVYLARDIRHQREVAIKVLRPDLAAALGPERFLREIRIAANLNHPHILPLFDSGEADGFLYYVMPYVEGDTLRTRIEKEGELPVAEAVKIIREIADALAFAHSKGVVHRDIKPDNVMLTGGHAVVTDFGVAKAISEATGRDKLTTAGVALGTPAYMAPEQATADPHIDHRADIYAIGAVAYELLTGRTPFTGATPQSILAAHVTEQVEPVSKYRDHVTAELEAVIMRCLEKKPADRWQSAEELLPHLEAAATPTGGLTPAATMPVPTVTPRNRFFRPAFIVGAVALLTLGVVGKQILTPTPFAIATSNIRQLTALSGIEYQPDMSPDGNDVVYVAGRLGETQLFVQSVAAGTAGNPLALAEDLPGFRGVPEWSQDGQSISFLLCDEVSFVCSTREVAKLGGPIRTLFSDSTWIIRSPDRERIAFVRDTSVLVAQPDGSQAEVLAVVEGEGTPHSLAWSPDGSRIAFVKGNARWVLDGNIAPSSIWVVRVEDGTLVQVTSGGRLHVSPQWMPDSRHLLFVSDRDGPRDIYVVEVGDDGARGEPQRVTGGGADPHSISISADGSRLAYSKFTLRRNIWSLPISESGPLSTRQATAVTSGNQIVETFSLSPGEDSIAFDSHLRGNQDIYKMSLSGGTPQPLTDDPADDFSPHWSPDGTEIAFYSTRTGDREIWVMDADGSNEMRLTRRPGDDRIPRWSPDGLSIAFSSFSPGTGWSLWIMRREQVGGEWSEPELLSSDCAFAEWASDGTNLVCGNFPGGSFITSGGELLRRLDPPLGSLVSFGGAHFAPGDSLLYVQGTDADGGSGFWLIPLSGADPIKLVAFDDPDRQLFISWAGSRDMYFTLSEYESDIWVMDLEW